MNNQISDQELSIEAVVWIVVTAIHQPGLRAKRKDLHLERNKDFVELCQLGCDARVLQDVLVYAAEMPNFYPPISALAQRNLARDIRSVLGRMIRTTPSLELPWGEDLENGQLEISMVPTGADLHVSAKLQKNLSLKADAYEGLARLCTKRMVPTYTQFKRLAYLWPVFYVEEKTGKCHCAKIAKLLGFVGIDKNAKQLMRGVAHAKKTSPELVDWMKLGLSYIEDINQETLQGQ